MAIISSTFVEGGVQGMRTMGYGLQATVNVVRGALYDQRQPANDQENSSYVITCVREAMAD